MIPTFKKADHFGFTVPDLAQAVVFFQDVLGAESVGEAVHFESPDDWMKKHLDIHPRAVIKKIQMLCLADGFCIELFEYEAPDQCTDLPRNSDHGGHHLCFEVDDIDAAVTHLKAKGVKVLGEPTYNDPVYENLQGVFKGIKWVYFQTPWGLNLEFVQKPAS